MFLISNLFYVIISLLTTIVDSIRYLFTGAILIRRIIILAFYSSCVGTFLMNRTAFYILVGSALTIHLLFDMPFLFYRTSNRKSDSLQSVGAGTNIPVGSKAQRSTRNIVQHTKASAKDSSVFQPDTENMSFDEVVRTARAYRY